MFWFFFLAFRYTLGSLLLGPLLFMSKKVKERRSFEAEHGPRKFKNRAFDTWFHVSSEGELEQVWPLLESLREKEVLLLYTSPSLKNKMMTISETFPKVSACTINLMSLLPYGSNHILSLVPPKKFFMVRYDFFPELILIGRKAKTFILLSASLKGKESSFKRNFFKRFYYHLILSSFQTVFAAGERDKKRIEDFYEGHTPFEIEAFDFRHGQIIRRQKEKANLEKTHCLNSLEKILENYEWQDRVILGSVWQSEGELFTKEFLSDLKAKKKFLFIAPHKLSGPEWEYFENLLESWEEEGLSTSLWNHLGIKGEGNIILCQVPGLLCEIYPFFGHCFVGGGHGRSVHSLLEPYWGGGHIYCGPKTHRSTEFDFVKERSPRHLHVVNEITSLYPMILKACEVAPDVGARESARESFLETEKLFKEKLLLTTHESTQGGDA